MQEGHFIKHDRSLPLKSVHIYLTLSANKVKKHWQIQKIATHTKKTHQRLLLSNSGSSKGKEEPQVNLIKAESLKLSVPKHWPKNPCEQEMKIHL